MSIEGLRSARWCDEYCQGIVRPIASDGHLILRLADCVVDAVRVGNSAHPLAAGMNDVHTLCRDL